MKNLIKNKQGMTLVEIVCAILILGIMVSMFSSGVITATRILTRAIHYKNSSSATASTVETGFIEESNDPKVSVSVDTQTNTPVIIALSDGTNIYSYGNYMVAEDVGSNGSNGTFIKYKEFLPSSYSYDVAAVPVVGD